MKLILLFYDRTVSAFLSFPDLSSWLISLLLLLTVAIICVPVGLNTGFLSVKVSNLSVTQTIKVSAICFIFPAIAEEFLFRVLLVPHKSEDVSMAVQFFLSFISLLLYVLSHPLNAITFYKKGDSTFKNPIFLLLTFILGSVCTFSYIQSGSIWTSAVIHWLTVLGWLLLLNGYAALNRT